MELRKRATKGAPEGSDESTKTSPKSDASPTAQPAAQPAAPPKSKFSTFMTRTIVGLIMIFAFFGILSAGHAVVCCFVVLLQVFTFREMINIRFREAKEKKLWGFRSLHWYFLFVTFFWVYGQQVAHYFHNHIPAWIYDIVIHRHNWHSFVLYVVGFMGVVFSFRKQTVKYQIGQVTWTIMTILLVVIQPHFVTRNVYQGLIWLMLPHSMIICNDIMAYFVGIAIGRKFVDRPLTRLSPNKTWEGFVGALILTLIYAIIAAEILSNLEYFRCSKAELDNHGGCAPGFMFTPTTIPKILNVDPSWIPEFINSRVIIKPVQLHALVFSLFASLVAPFGGFLASAIKRACIHEMINFSPRQNTRKRFLDPGFILRCCQGL
eukprot:TRINITY_DN1225_c0_g2_i1.p1 TRINITY_DN1225_c0_g2~~TRINITY_DN1225_c0_g2_i1.p1  ORF type:complete len:377 (+),score=71.02 TRINITY_DN1225_c0_g2_i1:63-1193(+)